MLKSIDKTKADQILNFAIRQTSEEEFIRHYPEIITREYVIECLQSALQQQDSVAVDSSMTLAFRFDYINEKMLPVLEQLLIAGWHTRNEDIAHELQRLASPTSIEPLFYAITTKFGYRDNDELYSFQVQCVWALGAINTSDSWKKIKDLSTSDIKPIRNAGKHQMKMWKIT